MSQKDWKDGTYESFTDWALKQFGHKGKDSDDDVEAPFHMKKAKDIVFETNRRGILMLPLMSEYRKVRDKQRVIRGYVGAVYS